MTEVPSVNRGDELDGVLDTINKLARKSRGGDYIYRGEPKHHDTVSSSLYREYQDIEAENFDIEVAQKEILSEAKKYTASTDEFEILTELQHYGGKTNLIDFTTDYLVALFFACDGSPTHDGRVILLQKSGEMSLYIRRPRNPSNRVIAQKSVFVRPPEGFIQPDHAVTIPKIAKHPLLDHLRNCHGISAETVYNDLHGFLRYQDIHRSAYAEFFLGLTWQNRNDNQRAIKHYTRSINANPQAPNPYNNRGNTYFEQRDFDQAIRDYDKALALSPNDALPYFNRGSAYAMQGEVDLAIRDYNRALVLNPNYADAYWNRGLAYQFKGDIDLTIQDLNRMLELKPNAADAYRQRGIVHGAKGEVRRSIQDFDKALELNPNYAEAYYSRGFTWLNMREWERARSDLSTAKKLGVDIKSSFRASFVSSGYQSVSEFQQKNNIELPTDITALLT